MSLITRCPSCHTLFRVVPDQLKVSEGWVRCGQCDEIFDATAHLQGAQAGPDTSHVAVERPENEVTSALHARSSSAEEVAAATEASGTPAPLAPAALPADHWTAHALIEPLEGEAPFAATELEFPATLADDDGDDVADGPVLTSQELPAGRSDPTLEPLAERAAQDPAEPGIGAALPTPEPSADSRPDLAVSATTLSFMRRAHRRAFWRRGPVRLVLALLALLLGAGLFTQFLVQERDQLAVYQPGLRTVLTPLCVALGCEIRPLRRIESVTIDSSAFTKLRGDLFRLSLTLRNGSDVAVAVPSVELSLTDSLDQPLVRKVLSPGELGAHSAVLDVHGELQSTLVFSLADSGGERVVGYRLLAFYP